MNRAVLTPTEHHCNAKFCGVRCIIEPAFGLLKSRGQILLKQNKQKLKSVARTVTEAVAMHNFCLKLQDFYEPEEEIDNETGVKIPPENELCDEGQDKRNANGDYLVEQRVI